MTTNEKPPYGEEDSTHPLPEEMRLLMVYDETDTLIDPLDVVSFFSNKESQEESADIDNSLSSEANTGSNVMRVKSGRSSFSGTSTTTAPPAFQNSGSYPQIVNLVLLFFVAFTLRHNIPQILNL